MSQKYFMLDIESMGTDQDNDDIIQIGILETQKDSTGYYIPMRSYQRTLFTDQEPKDDWIRTNHADLLTVCRKQEYASPVEIRADILNFFQRCGVNELAHIMGLNVTGFDISFMVKKGYLQPSHRDSNNILKGDFHYRQYELRGALNLTEDVLNINNRTLAKEINKACDWITLPEGKKHDALYDCYSQLKDLNGMIKLLRVGAM